MDRITHRTVRQTSMLARRLRCGIAAAALVLAAGTAGAQTLEVAVDASPAGLDPHIVTAFSSSQIVLGPIYEGLTALDKDLNIVPGLAQSWTVSQDGKTVTFKLRPGVTFHDGKPMEAEDVASSLRRVVSKDVGSPLASRLAAMESVTAVDATTLELKLKEPSAPLLASLAGIAIVPRGLETNKDALQRAPVGTGPFKFEEWQPNGFIRLSKHAGYWNAGQVKLAGVRFNFVPEAATRAVGIGNGQFALLPHIDAATAMQLEGKPNIGMQKTQELAYTLIGMNVSKPPFDNAKVREALNYALNRKEIIDAALFGAGAPAAPLPPVLKDWAVDVKDLPCYAFDPAKAQALLKDSGVALPISVSMTMLPRQDIRDIAQVVQQQLNKVGIKVELKNPELGQFVQDWRNSNFDLFASTNAGSIEPDDYFYRAFRTGGSTNVFKYSNPEIDALLDKGRSALDKPTRQTIYRDVQKILGCSGPAAHIAYPTLFSAVRSNLQGYQIYANRSLVSLGGASLR